MANERLRSALLSNGYTAATLAAELGVDRKSVERWVAGRTPYRRYRFGAAERLGVEESYLWPDALDRSQVTDASASEIVTVYPHRSAVPRDAWHRLFSAGLKELAVLETRGLLLADDPHWRSLLADRVADGTRVRVLLDDHRHPEDHEGDDRPDGRVPAPAGPAEAPETRILLDSLRELPGVEVRLHTAPPFASVYRADDELLVTCHVHGAPAALAPVLALSRVAGGELVSTYAQSFERIWEGARPLD